MSQQDAVQGESPSPRHFARVIAITHPRVHRGNHAARLCRRCLVAGGLADRYGRKTVMVVAAILFAGDSAGSAYAFSEWDLMAWCLVGVIPALVYGVLALIIPESPQYLIRQGRDDEAARVLSRVSGVRDTVAKTAHIRDSFEREDKASYRDLRRPAFGLQPILWVGMAIAALQQLVGINAIFHYSTTLWQSVGFSKSDSFTTSVITSIINAAIINVAITFVAIFFVDRIGRRKFLLAGSVGMTVGLFAATIAFSQASGSGVDISLSGVWGPTALVGANLFVIFFARPGVP